MARPQTSRNTHQFISPANKTTPSYSDYIAGLDGFSVIPGGWVNQNYVQLGYQLADSVASFSYSFVMTCLILFLMNMIPGLSLRVAAEEEELGIDDAQLGEFAYDYVEITRNFHDIAPSGGSSTHQPEAKGEEKV